MATSQQIHGQFRQVSGAVQQKYGEISDDDIRQTEGSFQKLIGLIEEKTGQSREQAEAYVNDLSERARASYQASAKAVAERPIESVVAAFTVGMIAGVMVGLGIASAQRPEPSWRNGWRS
nr:CsbD family protein [Rhodopirellula sp. JC639]